MALPTPEFNIKDVDIIQRETVYKRFFAIEKLSLRHRLFEGGWSEVITRELFVRGEAVGILLFDPKLQKIALVEQFRVGALPADRSSAQSPWLLEIVAGMFDGDESPEAVVYREVKEETGLAPERLVRICDYFVSPGGTSEKLHVYCALCDLTDAGGIYGLPEEGENIRLHVLSVNDVFTNLYSGRFNNAASLIALQWLQLNIHTL